MLPIPKFYRPETAEEWGYRPDIASLFLEATKYKEQHKIKPSSVGGKRIHLLLIDVQRDFCHPSGTLYVGGRSGKGAMEDSKRTAEFIYRNLDKITDITTTLDTHFAYQIFYPWFWLNESGQPLQSHTLINISDKGRGLVNLGLDGSVLNENVVPNPALAQWICNGNYGFLQRQVEFYCSELARQGKYTLYLWPPHCLLGSDGHALVGTIFEARMFHSLCRESQSESEVKGGHPLTENYSVFRPEVLGRYDGNPLVQKNTRFLKTLFSADAVIAGGQAASHCAKSSIDDLLNEILAEDPSLVKKLYILRDCMSAVVVPGADFTPQAEEALKKFADAGMHVVDSTTPMTEWEGLNLA